MDFTPQQRYFMLVGRLVVEDEMEAEEAIRVAAVLHAAFIEMMDEQDEQDTFEVEALAGILQLPEIDA